MQKWHMTKSNTLLYKVLVREWIQGTCFNLRQGVDNKSTTNILNIKNLNACSLKFAVRHECPLFPFLFDIVFEVLARAGRPVMNIKGYTRNRRM